MYTLKIRWMRHEEQELVDETTLFISADEVRVHSEIESDNEMSAWSKGDYLDYRIINMKSKARLIEVIRNEKSKWYLTNLAWLLGPDGKTIERLTN